MTDTLIIVGLVWFALGAVVLLPVCALLRTNRERMEAEEDPWRP